MEVPAQLVATEKPTGAPGVFRTDRASAASFGGLTGQATSGVGAAFDKAGDVAMSAAMSFQKQQNETDVEKANVGYEQRRRSVLFDDGGFYTKRGKDAYDSMAPTAQSIEKIRMEAREALANPQQQRMFDIVSRRNTEADLRSMSMHAAQENRTYRLGVTEASIANSMAESALHWNDPVRFARELGTIAVQAENRARMLGRTDPEQLKADVAHYQSLAIEARIDGTAIHDPELAEQMYRANEDKIVDPARKVALEHRLKQALLPWRAKTIADRVVTPDGIAALTQSVSMGTGAANAAADATAAGGSAPGAKPSRESFDATLRDAGEASAVSSSVQIERDQKRLELLRKELASPNNDQNDRKNISTEIAGTEARIKKLTTQPDIGSAAPADSATGAKQYRGRDAKALLGDWIAAGAAEAERIAPNDPFLRDMAISEIKNRASTIVASGEGAQRQAHGVLMSLAAGVNNGQPGGQVPTTVSQLLSMPGAREAWSKLDGDAMAGVMARMDQNAARAEGKPHQVNARLVQDLFTRMYLPPDDPQAITKPEQLTQYIAQGLTPPAHTMLIGELDKLKDGPPAFQRDVQNVRRTFDRMVRSGLVGRALADVQPERIEAATYAFSVDLNQKIDEYRKSGKDPRLLITPGTPEFVLEPARVHSYLPSAQDALRDAANKVRTAGAQSPQFEVGKVYQLPQGKFKYNGGNADVRENWEPAAADAVPAAVVSASAPPAAPAGPAIPTLVDPSDKKLTREERRAAAEARQAETAAQIKGAAAVAANVAAQVALSPIVGVAKSINQARAIGEALTPSEAERASTGFRALVKAGKFTAASEPVIADAIASGMLTDNERATAQAMLDQINAKKDKR